MTAQARSAGPVQKAGLSQAVRLSVHQFRYDLRAFLRNRQARFFTLVLPVLFLVIFASLFHRSTVKVAGGTINTSVYYVPGIIALGIISAAFVNLVISVTAQRESGALKRRRATPVPASAIIAGRALTSVIVALGITALLLIIGWLFYHASVPGRTAPALVVTVIVGALSFCCLGFALASVIRSEDSAQPITQATMLPLYFISGIFVAISILPHWLVDIANVFPVRHLAAALLTAYNPHTTGAGFAGTDLLVVALWGVGGLAFALWRFSWLPRSR
ncbi:MAG: ABC transporter permease [Streptosporangiaceae bacterium]